MELLVRVVSKTNPNDKVLDSKLTKAGDVIVYKPDGSDWGIAELKNPDWRIIRVEGMTEEQAVSLVSPELPPTLDKEYPLLQRRAIKLDLTQLDSLTGGKVSEDQTAKVAEIDSLINDAKQGIKTDSEVKQYIAANAVESIVDSQDVISIVILKEPLKDEGSIEVGPSEGVIG